MAHSTAILVSLVALFSLGHADTGFDYLMLSLEWPPSFCKTKSCDFPSSTLKGWNIHGLWPSNFHSHYPEYCQGASFDPDKLEPIRSLLQVNWADLLHFDSPDGFWSQEWKKHGKCCSNDSLINTELKYFNISVQLKLAADVNSAMSKSGIVPTSDDTYQISDIEAALRKAYGVTVNIRCVESDGDVYWVETRLCFDPKLGPIDCPEESSIRRLMRGLKTVECGDDVKYPPFDSERQALAMRWKRLQRGPRGFDRFLRQADTGFDFLMLSLEWPPSFCKTKPCDYPSSVLNGWNIHGLWPAFYGRRYRKRCNHGAPFDPNKLDPIRSLLQTNWANLFNYYHPDKFWSREWNKHGKCCNMDRYINTELKYFNTSVQLKLNANVESTMSRRGIVPSSNTYQISDIKAALKEAYNVTVNIRCIEYRGDAYWIETRLCFDVNLGLIDCPEKSTIHSSMPRLKTIECVDDLYYPYYDSERDTLVKRWKRLKRGPHRFDRL